MVVLSGTAPTFLLHLWYQIVPQDERQLLLLRQTKCNPKVNAYKHLYGQHYNNAHPFVPIGMECVVHEKPRRRKTFAQHCKRGFVLGTSPYHYQAWNVWMEETRSERVSATVFFKHKYIKKSGSHTSRHNCQRHQQCHHCIMGQHANSTPQIIPSGNLVPPSNPQSSTPGITDQQHGPNSNGEKINKLTCTTFTVSPPKCNQDRFD